MGSAMGENPEILEEVSRWVNAVATKPVWAKMTPNVTHIEDPARAAFRAECEGVSAINTIRSVLGVNLETLRPEPTVEGYTTLGGYSCRAVLPIALRMVMEISQVIRKEYPGRSISGIGGVETGEDAAQFILLGADTVQVCTGVMKHGYGLIKPLCERLLAFMEQHKFERLEDFRGHSVQFFTTHADLVKRQAEARAAAKAKHDAGKMIRADDQWHGDDFVKQSDALARG
jgi:dihydropyrimidine dehydrogenase (NADP+)/dihydropyrimidine dehydrogenase (NAD+) subunit PreA